MSTAKFAAAFEAAVKYARDPQQHDAFYDAQTEAGEDHLPSLVFADSIEEEGNAGAAAIIRQAVERKGVSKERDVTGTTDPRHNYGTPDTRLGVTAYTSLPLSREGEDPQERWWSVHLIHYKPRTRFAHRFSTRMTSEQLHDALVQMTPEVAGRDSHLDSLERVSPWLRNKRTSSS